MEVVEARAWIENWSSRCVMYREKPRLDREEWLTRHIEKGALRIYVPMVGMPIHPGVTPPLAFYVTLPACLPRDLSVTVGWQGWGRARPRGGARRPALHFFSLGSKPSFSGRISPSLFSETLCTCFGSVYISRIRESLFFSQPSSNVKCFVYVYM